MPSSPFTCVKPSDLGSITQAARDYRKMGTLKVVCQAAKKAADHVNMALQKTIKGDASLADFHHVADAMHVHESSKNVYAGLPNSHALYATALEMDALYPVNDVVIDLTKQQGDTEAIFCAALASGASA